VRQPGEHSGFFNRYNIIHLVDHRGDDDSQQPAAAKMTSEDSSSNSLPNNTDARSPKSNYLPNHPSQTASSSRPSISRMSETGLPVAVSNTSMDNLGPNEALKYGRGNSKRDTRNDERTEARDLTGEVRLVEPHALFYGGCSDIYHGVWTQHQAKGDVHKTILVRAVSIGGDLNLIWRVAQVALKVPRAKGRRDLARRREVSCFAYE
jgi:hypothetical protein